MRLRIRVLGRDLLDITTDPDPDPDPDPGEPRDDYSRDLSGGTLASDRMEGYGTPPFEIGFPRYVTAPLEDQ